MTTARIFRVTKLVFAVLIGVGVLALLFLTVRHRVLDPASPLRKFRDVPVPPHFVAHGLVHRAETATEPPVCRVTRQYYGPCGKGSAQMCWRNYGDASLTTASGTFEPAWSSSPIPSKVQLSPSWETDVDVPTAAVKDPERIAALQTQASRMGLRFDDLGERDRLAEKCVADGSSVYLEGCVVGGMISPCADRATWSWVVGTTPRPAIAHAVDVITWQVAGEFLLLLLPMLLLIAPHGVLVDALASRAKQSKRKWGWYKALFALPILALVGIIAIDDRFSGFVAILTVIVFWGALVKRLVDRRRYVLDALGPVLSIQRSPLAKASGTAELVVSARQRGPGVPRVLEPTPTAFVEIKVFPAYAEGKNTRELPPIVFRPQRELDVVDESGQGVIDLEHAVLDVPVREEIYTDVPPRLAERGVRLEKHPAHRHFRVEERSIGDGDSLYVLGEVSELTLRPDGSGYRSVRGSPKVGGQGVPPVIVFAGDERGLVGSFRREAAGTQTLAIACTSLAAVLAGIAIFLGLQ